MEYFIFHFCINVINDNFISYLFGYGSKDIVNGMPFQIYTISIEGYLGLFLQTFLFSWNSVIICNTVNFHMLALTYNWISDCAADKSS
jgi:hypothetical protein